MNRCASKIVCLPLLFLATGCGLNDYESLMVNAQRNTQSFDEAIRVLGEPLVPPKVKEQVGKETFERPASVFYRPPRGIAVEDDGEPLGNIAHRYPRVAGAGKPTATSAGEPKEGAGENLEKSLAAFRAVYMAAAIGRKDLKQLATDVLQLWSQDAGRLQQRQGLLPQGASKMEALDFDDDAASYSAYFIQGTSGTMIGLVFCYERGSRDSVQRLIDLSLRWMGVDGKAAVVSGSLARRKKQAPAGSKTVAPAATPAPQPKKQEKAPLPKD